ncbi:MAG: HD domain-containing protein [Candidatus Paceibacterota bacterium]
MNPSTLTKEYILNEVKKIQYLYGLKYEIRYAQNRPSNIFTESVAEHIYGMHICAQYFLPLEDPKGTWDKVRIYELITLHDIDELETGDMLGYLKTDDIRDKERESKIKVLEKLPDHLKPHFEELINDYENQETSESHFVKAIDRFEPLLQMYSEFGRHVINHNKTTSEQAQRIKKPYLEKYPVMQKFNQVIHQTMIDERLL